MDGNPETDPAWALAYEQRTANLIALLDMRLRMGYRGTTPIDRLVDARLGLEEREQCTARESGGYRCDLDAGHAGRHWVDDETIGLF